MEDSVCWSIQVSRETDLAIRTLFGAHGMQDGDLSTFVEEAVRTRVFHQMLEDIKLRNAETSPEEFQALTDDAVHEVRTGHTHETQ